MSYLNFDKNELVNLEYSLARETIRTNRSGSFASSTIIGCNTRKYHGLLVCPMEDFNNDRHVLLSILDATVIYKDNRFPLGVHQYKGGVYAPKGHMYVRDFDAEPIPRITYGIGDLVLEREILLVQEEERILVRYTVIDTQAPITLSLQPFLACRPIHQLSKANLDANLEFSWVKNGIKSSIYPNYPPLYMQASKKMEFIPAPDWYYDFEYIEEQKRGYEYHEDLYMPGYFEIDLKKGESFIFCVGLKEAQPTSLKKLYEGQLKKRVPRDSFENCLINSAQQFLVKKRSRVELIAGYPWFGKWGRDSFIALPGLTLSLGDLTQCKEILDSKTTELRRGLFMNNGEKNPPTYNSADAPLWFIWAVQQYSLQLKNKTSIWNNYGVHINNILQAYREGTDYNIHMLDSGLIFAGEENGDALTWMDATESGQAVTPRVGMPVELNALWYNAVCFALEISKKDKAFQNEWKNLPLQIASSFIENFWSESRGHLADYTNADYKDWAIRPNQVFATSLPYSPLNEEMRQSILEIVEDQLLTPKGLRTLSPAHPDYKGVYGGDLAYRDSAYHQGTAWPWLLGAFCEGLLKIYGASRLAQIEQIYQNFEEEMWLHGVGSVSEIHDGNPPHRPNGAISQACSIAELLRIRVMIQKYKKMKPKLSPEIQNDLL